MTGSAGALGYAGSKLHPINASLSDTTTETYSDITFAASRSAATFGRSATVQPSAVRLLAIIRPDITGGFGDVVWTRTVRGAHIVGATISQSVNRNVTNEGSEYVGWVDFQASKSASIYGGSTVQPASVRLMPIIKA